MVKMKFYLLAPMLAVTLAACGGGSNDKAAAAATKPAAPAAPAPTSTKVLKVAVEHAYPPFIQSLPSGKFEGYDIDVLNAIGEKAGFTVSYSPYAWDSLFQQLNNGAADVVAGGLTATEMRKTTMDFTEPYDTISLALAVPNNSPIKTFADIRDKNVSFQTGTTAALELAQIQNKALNTSNSRGSAWLTIKAALSGQENIDAAIGDSATFEYYARKYKDANIRVVYNDTVPSKPIGFVVKKGNAELLSQLNKGLADIKADGTLDKIRAKWISKQATQAASSTK